MTIHNKTYASRRNALRAAESKGITNPVLIDLENGRIELRDGDAPLYNSEFRVKSECNNPCKLVWDLCFNHKNAKRRDIISMAIEAGVSFNTAQSNYQAWRKAEGLVTPRAPKEA